MRREPARIGYAAAVRFRFAALAITLAVSCVVSRAQASPADLFGFGPRSQAMGGGGAAVGRGFEATFENPALLSYSRHRELSLGIQAARFSLSATGPNAPGNVPEEPLNGTYIGAVLPLPFGGILKNRLVLGLGAFTPSSLIARARLLYPERPQFPLLADRAQSLDFNMALGADIGHGIRVGVGARALAELVGTVVVRTDASGHVGTAVDDQLVATYAPVVGASYEHEKWMAGLTWRGELNADFDVTVQVHDLGQLVVPELHIAGVAQYDPMQLQAEVARRIGPWTLAGGLTWKHWSAFPGWARPTVECPKSRPDCKALKVTPVDFHDTVVPRLGAEYSIQLSPAAVSHVRGGYFFEMSPVPEQTRESNYWDNDRHVITLGYGVELSDPLPPISFDLFYQLHLLAPRSHHKDGSVDPSNVGYPDVRTSGTVQDFGLIAGVKF